MGTASGAAAAPACTVEYTIVGQWAGGHQGAVTVTHHGAPLTGRSLGFSFPACQAVEPHRTHGQYTGNSAGCSDVHASCRKPMPGARYTPAFRTSAANTLKSDDRGLSYPGWTRNTGDCGSGSALISAYDGTPTAFGTGLRDRLRALTT